jgi:hypothetical protein
MITVWPNNLHNLHNLREKRSLGVPVPPRLLVSEQAT